MSKVGRYGPWGNHATKVGMTQDWSKSDQGEILILRMVRIFALCFWNKNNKRLTRLLCP